VEFMVVNDYLIQLLIHYLESNINLKLSVVISGLTHKKHILMIKFDKTIPIIDNVTTYIDKKMIDIYNQLKIDIERSYPIYQTNIDIVVIKTINSLIEGSISFNDIRLENVTISVMCFNVSVFDMNFISTMNQRLHLIGLNKFLSDNPYILPKNIEQIKHINCYYKSYINFTLHLTGLQLNNLICNNEKYIYAHNLLCLYINKVYLNIIEETDIIISSACADEIIVLLKPYFVCSKVHVGDGLDFDFDFDLDLYDVNIKLSQKYQSKVKLVNNYLKSIIISLSRIISCLIDNSEVDIHETESDSDSNH